MYDWLRKRSHGGIEDLGALRHILCTPNSVNMITILSCINASNNFFDHRMILVLVFKPVIQGIIMKNIWSGCPWSVSTVATGLKIIGSMRDNCGDSAVRYTV